MNHGMEFFYLNRRCSTWDSRFDNRATAIFFLFPFTSKGSASLDMKINVSRVHRFIVRKEFSRILQLR